MRRTNAQNVCPNRQAQSLSAELATSISVGLSKSGIACPELGGLARGLCKQLSGSAATLEERAAAGFVRRCHGDLHLANIVMWEGRPALYDAIEFDEAVATIDTLYDLAFLLMDLDRHNQRPAANIVLNRYLWQSGMPLDLAGPDRDARFSWRSAPQSAPW